MGEGSPRIAVPAGELQAEEQAHKTQRDELIADIAGHSAFIAPPVNAFPVPGEDQALLLQENSARIFGQIHGIARGTDDAHGDTVSALNSYPALDDQQAQRFEGSPGDPPQSKAKIGLAESLPAAPPQSHSQPPSVPEELAQTRDRLVGLCEQAGQPELGRHIQIMVRDLYRPEGSAPHDHAAQACAEMAQQCRGLIALEERDRAQKGPWSGDAAEAAEDNRDRRIREIRNVEISLSGQEKELRKAGPKTDETNRKVIAYCAGLFCLLVALFFAYRWARVGGEWPAITAFDLALLSFLFFGASVWDNVVGESGDRGDNASNKAQHSE